MFIFKRRLLGRHFLDFFFKWNLVVLRYYELRYHILSSCLNVDSYYISDVICVRSCELLVVYDDTKGVVSIFSVCSMASATERRTATTILEIQHTALVVSTSYTEG